MAASTTVEQLGASPWPLRVVQRLGPARVTFVVSGGLEADEDLACAELIAHISGGEQPDPIPYLARAVKSAAAADLELAAKRKYPGVAVEDVAMCCELDRFDFAMCASAHAGSEVRARSLVSARLL
jgi:2-phosphosulfolactate phosphatase